ncbi:MAG TPA: sulfatase, partial [Verrucomicrobiae bacterium]|nr:sulfatase [Verrucomicrobiae bacterium]
DKSGQIDAARTWAITGRERHVDRAREGNLPYPMRALRTKDFLYIRNFAPDRWPMGSPGAVTENSEPSQNKLEHDTFIAFADMDGSPTKAWLVQHRHEAKGKWYYDLAFGKRQSEELYDLGKDPDMVNNVANSAKYAKVKDQMSADLMKKLQDAHDPRVSDDVIFEKPPYTNGPKEKPSEPNLFKP